MGGRILVICGPSGVGKGTIVSRLLSEYPGRFALSVSHTTRSRRANEREGVHYYFTDRKEMEKDILANKFLEHASVHSNLYGTSYAEVSRITEQSDKICLLEIDVQGVQNLQKSIYHSLAKYIFISPPDIQTLEHRLRARATESDEVISLRLKRAQSEIAELHKINFDFQIQNLHLHTTYNNIKNQINTWFKPQA